ncbi:class I SAM-dependent methyltransferase [Streptomyces sp. NPDC102406]|uniref:class I SAM-dependent methyltransferase n=1 Tax=Streptomyces sp. NPDC102406 TaxID=3366171 RepID=UPI0038300425
MLDVGCGSGHPAVHLARAHGARATGIERSPTRHQRATTTHAGVTDVDLIHGDVADHLAAAEPFDAAYAIGSLAFINPHRALPACRPYRPASRRATGLPACAPTSTATAPPPHRPRPSRRSSRVSAQHWPCGCGC